ncbi:condensation domain-containing protein, partial [Paenibacillus sp. NRS-1783]|uniref:condensation domain-containing protein n=1 Tax=Paenibacillus sp. NRS-1783 TaxID=3233907 RepID=UPI003D26B2DE
LLPAPEGSLQTGADYIAPRTWTESKLAQIWQDVLGLEQVGVKENFFEIGGHSLRATTLASKIHKELNKPLLLRFIFEAPTIEQLAVVMEGLDQVVYSSIPVTEERSFYPLSSAQKRMYVLHQIDPQDVNYNIPAALQVSGPLDIKRVEKIFRQLISRHAAFRTRFELMNSEPIQRIQDTVTFEVEYAKVQAGHVVTYPAADRKTHVENSKRDIAHEQHSSVSEQLAGKEVQEWVQRFVRPFDLQAAPLLRVALIDLGVQGIEEEPQHLLMLDMHHIISDGASMGVLTNEFVRLYSGEELSTLRIQYKDYAVWQQSESQQNGMKRQEAYWLDTFRGELPTLNLPTDFTRPAVRSTAGDTVVFELRHEVSEQLKELAVQTGSTLYMLLLAAYTVLLHQYTGQEDIIVGTPIAGRPHMDLEPIIGMFVGTLAMRNYPTAALTFRHYVEDVKTRTLQAYEHQDYPFEELVEQLNVKRDMSRNPLFDTMFVLQNNEQGELKLEGLSFHPYAMEQVPAKFDLMLEASEEETGIHFGLQYATSLYQRETIEQITRHFVRLVETITANPDISLCELERITIEETVPVLKVHQERQKAARYWNAYLDGYEEQAHLPQVKMQSNAGYQAEQLNTGLSVGLTTRILQIAKRHQVTLNTLMQSVWGILLQKYNGIDDVVLGSTVSGHSPDLLNVEHMMGLSQNTVPVRIRSNENSLFSQMMKQNEEQSIAAHMHTTHPLTEIQALSDLKQNWINHRIIFANDPAEKQMQQFGEGQQTSFSRSEVEPTSYDFNLVIQPGKVIHMSFNYNALVFERTSIEQIQGHLVQLLEQVTANPDIRIRELDVVTKQEREQILGVWGDTEADCPSEQTIHGLFEAQAAQTPEQAALFFEGEQLTYSELNERANRLARILRSHGVTTDRLVGLMTERSVDMIVGMFGIMKAGGAYIPIDPTYPEERIRYMLDDSG